MEHGININLLSIVTCVSEALDLVSQAVVNHHKRVANIASSIAAELDLSHEKQDALFLSAALHDAGAFSLHERLELLNFDERSPWQHSELGYRLMNTFKPFRQAAPIVRYHHVPWNEGVTRRDNGKDVPEESYILHLADRISVLAKCNGSGVLNVGNVIESILEMAGSKFHPEHIEAFRRLSETRSFWAETVAGEHWNFRNNGTLSSKNAVSLDELLELAKLFSHIIDFRSRFTATHSKGVAESSKAIAKLMGFSPKECLQISIAGHLHDLGKLAVPVELLEKPEALTKEEFETIKKHPLHTYNILGKIEALREINKWASFHHEQLDGKGYPFGLKNSSLPLGSKIVAVSDVFTALTEDRPYRKGMVNGRALDILSSMANVSSIDADVLATLKDNYDEINEIRKHGQAQAKAEYEAFFELDTHGNIGPLSNMDLYHSIP